jgi:hypothetical protein
MMIPIVTVLFLVHGFFTAAQAPSAEKSWKKAMLGRSALVGHLEEPTNETMAFTQFFNGETMLVGLVWDNDG